MQPDLRTRLRRLLRGVASIPDLFATRRPADQTRETFRDYRWGTDCPLHLLRHWCVSCRMGEIDHPGSHTCECGATDGV